MSGRSRYRLRGLVVLALVFAACGGGDEEAAPGTVPPAGGTGITSAPIDSNPPDAGAGGDADFCSSVPDVGGSTVDITEPDGARAWVTGLVAVMSEVRAGAPAEIRDDVGVMLDAFEELAADMEAANYEFLLVDFASLESPQLDAAGDRVAQYYSDICGLSIDVATPGGGGTPPGPGDDFGTSDADFRFFVEAAYGQFLDDDQIDCLVASTTMEQFVTEPLGSMAACGIDIQQLGG